MSEAPRPLALPDDQAPQAADPPDDDGSDHSSDDDPQGEFRNVIPIAEGRSSKFTHRMKRRQSVTVSFVKWRLAATSTHSFVPATY
jgi:hypothetical protein